MRGIESWAGGSGKGSEIVRAVQAKSESGLRAESIGSPDVRQMVDEEKLHAAIHLAAWDQVKGSL